jgi:hypothetical protein
MTCEADLEVSKHGTVEWGECHVVGLGNIELLQITMKLDN